MTFFWGLAVGFVMGAYVAACIVTKLHDRRRINVNDFVAEVEHMAKGKPGAHYKAMKELQGDLNKAMEGS